MKKFNPISKKNLKFLITLSLISIIIYSCSDDDDDDDLYEYDHGIYYIELDGSPSQMGKKHGIAFKEKIHDAVYKYKQNIYKTFGKENGNLIIDWALTKATFTDDLKNKLPHVYQEIEALAAASELPVEDILLINLNEEITHAAPAALNITPKQNVLQGGTIIQVQTDNREKLSAQNIEYENSSLDKQQLMIRYKYTDREILIYTFIGRVGGIGVNSKGLSVLATNLPQGEKGGSDGLAQNYLLRLILEQDNVDSALEILKNTNRFAAYSYALADYKKSTITEESGDKFVSSPMLQYPGFQCHTNHMQWIEPKNRIDIPGIFENGEPVKAASSFYTIERLEQIKATLLPNPEDTEIIEDIDDDELQDIFTSPKINSTSPDFVTLQSAIIEYDEEALDMIISAGSDPDRKWNRYDF